MEKYELGTAQISKKHFVLNLRILEAKGTSSEKMVSARREVMTGPIGVSAHLHSKS